jgi:hypothetical protein
MPETTKKLAFEFTLDDDALLTEAKELLRSTNGKLTNIGVLRIALRRLCSSLRSRKAA